MSKKDLARQRALMAILVAAGLLSSTQTVYSAPNESAVSERQLELVKKIAENRQISPEVRAYFLIRIARSILKGTDEETLEQQYARYVSGSEYSRFPERLKVGLHYLAGYIAREARSAKENTQEKRTAEAALQQAWPLLETSGKSFISLHLYFMLSCLFQEIGNSAESAKCKQIVDAAISGCESDFNNNANQVEAVVSILNAKSYAIIPVHISDRSKDPAYKRDLSQSQTDWDVDLCDAEKLRQRALALVDRLPATSHLRRKAHRDMALWYTQLEQEQDAQKEKNALFSLVGIYDDKILYPQSTGCGNVIWWKAETNRPVMLCGLG